MERLEKAVSPFAWPLWIVLIVAQTVLSFFVYDQNGNEVLRVIAWITWVVMCIFALLPMVTLRKLGGVPKGQSYTHTTRVVDRGIYAIIRHPQYLSFMLLSLFFMLLAQHWFSTMMGILAILLVCFGILPKADQLNVEKFGKEYEHYRQRVPRVNFVAGIVYLLQRSNEV
jgi:protein-S-isoprenylcysteine O-methyltransferase Ste14